MKANNCKYFMKSLRQLWPLFILLINISGLHAGEIKSLPFPPITYARMNIDIDGKIDDWTGVEPTRYMPLNVGLNKAGVPQLDVEAIGVNIRMAYDNEALYIALEWLDPDPARNLTPLDDPGRWAKGGDGFAAHVLTDQMLHLVSWPIDHGKSMATYYCVGDSTAWRDAGKFGATACAAVEPNGKGYVQEFRLPWRMITASGIFPKDSQIEFIFDFSWGELTPDIIKSLQQTSAHVTCNFLTSRGKLFSRGHLPSSDDWGELIFSDHPVVAPLEIAPLGTGITSLHARRVQNAPTIDGSLADWKDVEFRECALAKGFLGDRYSARLATVFDNENLYLALHYNTDHPLQNTKPEASQAGFGGGDCLQVRLQRGDDKINLCAWYDTAAGKPALTADGKELPDPFLLEQGAREAFQVDKDGSGYTMEVAIPWKVLPGGPAAPQPGEKMKCTFQLWWAGLNPEFSVYGKTALLERGKLEVNYDLPKDAEVTLGVFDKQGRLLRWITQSEYRYAGENTEYWNGLDQRGKPIPAGEYQVKAVYHAPLTTEHVMTLANPGNPPWPTEDGKGDWLSDEASPQAVATDGKWVFLAAPGSEKGCSIIALDEQGQRQWGLNEEFYPRCVSLAIHGDYLYALYSGPELTDSSKRYNGKNAIGRAILLCVDKKTGRYVRFSKSNPRLRVATWPYREDVTGLWELRRNMSFTPGNYAGQPRYFCYDLGESSNALGIAATSKKLYLSLYYEDKLLVLNASTGERAGEIPIAKPVGLHALSDDTLLAVSGSRIVKIDAASGEITPVVTNGLLAPHSVTTDQQGNIYVSDWKTSFQVKVFSPQGKFLHVIGKEGGRPWLGAWEQDGMLVPRGLSVTDDGKLWVAEDDTSPGRVSVWNAKTGAFIKDYIGPAPYGGGAPFWIDPKDSNLACTLGVRFKLDFKNKTYTPLATVFRRMDRNQPFAVNGFDLFGNKGHRILYREGREYLVINGYHMIKVLMRKGDIYVPVAAAGGISRLVTDDGTGSQFWDSDIGYHLYKNYYPECFRGHAGDNFSWADLNADGLVQAEEMRWEKTLSRNDNYVAYRQPEWMSFMGGGIAPDWSFFYSGFCKNRQTNFRLDVDEWTANGIPIYDIKKAKCIGIDEVVDSVWGLYVNAENHLFISYKTANRRGNEKCEDSLACFDRDGKPIWAIANPKSEGPKDVKSTNVIGEFTIPGIGNIVCTWQWWGNWRPYFITSDGLYLGTALDETSVGPAALVGEAFNYFYQAPDGTPYIINGAYDGHHILKIKGLENAGRFSFPITISSADALLANTIKNLPAEKKRIKPVINILWLNSKPVIDGDLNDWNMNDGVSLKGGKGCAASVALRRDEDTLYLAYKVEDDSPLLNKGENWQTLFITGDCVDLMLATDTKANPYRREPANGDFRLLFSVYQDNPIAVLYRPVKPGSKNPIRLMAASIDEISQLENAHVVCKRGEKSYVVEAAVPLGELGVSLEETGVLRGDVGIIYSDETGRNRSQRLYYYNQKTQMTSDLTTEATLQPGEWGPVQFPLGENLLRNSGFEKGFAKNREDGWIQEIQQNGYVSSLVTVEPHSGRQCLLLEQIAPVVFPDDAYTKDDWADFVKQANNGKGVGHVSVCQQVPVVGGRKYSLRLFYRTENLFREVKAPGKPRGYANFTPWVYWGSDKGAVGHVWVANEQTDRQEWTELFNADFRSHGVKKPYLAPPGATKAVISLKATTSVEGELPKIFVDDVEFVEEK